ncbi:nucleotide sugar dehydrogenase [Thiohalocapsa marina]|uniref:nucleotide sugar dehydrogenase n=1 Tax=Thiohalocapsa marina TaxID=424902 RepID=UPI0024828F42|nr:UDP binding domain-containing protein [Thiohalocapsa marina]
MILLTTEAIVPHLRPGQIVSLESTTWPGTTDEALKPRLEKSGLTLGQDLFLVFSPEREDPGNPNYSTRTIPKVLGGLTPACTRAGQALYGQVIDQVVTLSSTRAAEMTKLLENIHRAVNIGLVNELKIVCDRMDIDIHEVIRAAATKPFGFGVEKNVDDRRESPSIALMELLQAKGAEISYSDPHVPRFLKMRRHDFDLASVPLTPETLAAADCVLLATDHDRFDYALIKRHAPLIVDTRGRYQEPAENIVHA